MNKVSHFHIPVNDMDRAKKFYTSIFGWKVEKSDRHYQMVTTTPIDKSGRPKEAGGINGALFKRETSEDTVSLVIRVPSIEDYLKRIEEAGGKIITEKTPAEGIGFHAEFCDTEGNVIGLWEEKLHKN